MGTFEVC